MPDPELYAKPCAGLPEVAGADRSPFFFVSTSLPDCRKARLDFSNFRSVTPAYGRAVTTGPVERAADYQNAPRADRAVWFDELRRFTLAQAGGRIMVYVHGYHNDFPDQVKRAQTLARLAGGKMPVVLFDWTSRKRLAAYTYDAATAAWAQDQFDDLISELTRSPDIKVTVIAHSMGNRIAINGLLRLGGRHPERRARIDRVVLASPDFDRDQAQRSVLPALAESSRVLVYASAKDRPIQAATGVHGYALLGSTRCRNDVDFQRSRRLPGDDCHLIPVRSNVAVVDTSEVAAGPTRHADFVESCAVRRDLAAFLTGQPPPARSKLTDESGRVGFRIAPTAEPCRD